MLKVGEKVKIGEKEYNVQHVDDHILPCVLCNLKDCHKNKGFDNLKASQCATNCANLIPIGAYFEEVK